MQPKTTAKNAESAYDFLFVYAAYALRYVYLLVLIPFYGRVLGTEGYAVVLSAMSLMNISWLFAGWGFSHSGTRAIATAAPSEYGKLFGIHFSARIILSIVAIVCSAMAIQLSPLLSKHLVSAYSALALGILASYNLGWYFTGTGRPRQSIKLEVLGFVISLSLILSLVNSPDDADLAIIAQLVSAILVTWVAHYWIRKELSRKTLILFSDGVSLIRSSGYLFLYTSSSIVVGASSTYVLGYFLSPGLVGAYGAADRLVALGISVMGPMGLIFIPKVTALHASDKNSAYRLIRKILCLLLLISCAGALISYVLPGEIVLLIFGPGFNATAPILKAFSWIFPINALIIAMGSYVFIPQHQEKILAKIVLFGVALGLASTLLFAREFGGIGAAYSRIFGETSTLVLLLFAAWKMGYLSKIFLKPKESES